MKTGMDYSTKAQEIHTQLGKEGFEEIEKIMIASLLTQISSNIVSIKATTRFLGEQGLLK